MTRWARYGSTQRHKKPPQDPTPWEEFSNEQKKDLRTKRKRDKRDSPCGIEEQAPDKTSHNLDDSKREANTINHEKNKKSKVKFDQEEKSVENALTSPQSDNALCRKRKKGKRKNKKIFIETESENADEPQKNLEEEQENISGAESVNSGVQAEANESAHDFPIHKPDKKFHAQKQNFLEKVRDRRLKNGILLLPPKVERKLYLMKKNLREKGVPGETIKQIMRRSRRTEELRFRKTLKTCFNCRKMGHILSECPEINADVEQGTGICFKCGSTEHTSSRCLTKTSGFPFAKCFICHEQGHISRNCPKNKHGAYPKGGKCNLCGEIDHLKKDCPLSKKKTGIADVIVISRVEP